MDRKRCVLSKVLSIFGSNTSIESAIYWAQALGNQHVAVRAHMSAMMIGLA